MAQNNQMDTGITDPRVLRYQEEFRKRQQELPKGEVPLPPIPALNNPPPTTGRPMTMAEAAMVERGGGMASSIIQQPSAPKILPNDLLPAEATRDPAFVQGNGSQLAMYQPNLAMKYGVIRNGQPVPAAALRPDGPKLRPETLEGLKQLEALNAAAQKANSPDGSAEIAASSGTAGAAARLANSPGDSSTAPSTEADKKKIESALKGMDDFDYHTFRQMMMRDIINNEDQRKIIEERLAPMDLTELVMNGTMSQTVPIVPGKFEPEFEVVGGDVDLALKAIIAREAKSLDVSDQYYLDKFSMMALASGLKAINKIQLPSCRNEAGDFSEQNFMIRFNRVARLPLPMLASLGVNYFWFDVRARKLFVAERIKNG